MTFTDLAKSYVRTIVPLLVGLVISLAVRTGVDLHGYAPEVTAVVTALYYCAARAAEHYLSPRFGWLLGVAASPQYVRQANSRTRLKADRGVTGVEFLLFVAASLIAIFIAYGIIHAIHSR